MRYHTKRKTEYMYKEEQLDESCQVSFLLMESNLSRHQMEMNYFHEIFHSLSHVLPNFAHSVLVLYMTCVSIRISKLT